MRTITKVQLLIIAYLMAFYWLISAGNQVLEKIPFTSMDDLQQLGLYGQ
jgi:hypothetical protein